jgi:hypothetical protein
VSFVSYRAGRVGCIHFLAIWTVLALSGAAIGQPPEPQPPASQPPAPPPSTSPAPTPPAQTPARGAPEPVDPEFTFGLFYWLTNAHPDLRGGAAAPDFETLDLPGSSHPAPEAEVSFRVSPNDVIRVSAFQMTGKGNTTAPVALDLFGTAFAAGDYLLAQYKVSSIKASFEDLLYPLGRSSKLRFKTLWEVQATKTDARVDAPFDTTLASSSTFPSVDGSRFVVLPALGAALQYAATPNFHFELRGSGFGIPHHADTADAEGTIAYRVSHIEVVAGGRLYEWKTSPQNAEYFRGLITGGFVGLRWVSK